MLTLHLIGHVYVTYEGVPVRLSPKAVALIIYLALERQAQHRERLAELLWPTVEARKNLRVELARIRAAGLDIFPRSSKLLYLEEFTTDLKLWQAQPHPMARHDLSKWLAVLRGLPLSGLEDLGDPAMQTWLEQQRFDIQNQIEQHLIQTYQGYERRGQTWATRQISQRAAAVGYELPSSGLPAESSHEGPLPGAAGAAPPAAALRQALPAQVLRPESSSLAPRPSDPVERALDAVASGTPQIMMVHGPLGIGKNHQVDQALKRGGWLKLYAPITRTPRLVIASLAQQLLPHLDGRGRATIDPFLRQPGTPEEDVIKLATVLAEYEGAAALVLDHVHTAAVELASLLEFVLRSPSAGKRALIMLSRYAPLQTRLSRALFSRFPPEQCTQIELQPLSLEQVLALFEQRHPGTPDAHRFAAQLLQVSEGNPLHLLIHLNHLESEAAAAGQPLSLYRPRETPAPQSRWPSLIREKYQSEIDGWPVAFRGALEQLSVINGGFDLTLAQAALDLDLEASWDVVQEAVERNVLTEGPDVLPPLDLRSLKPLVLAGRPEPGGAAQGEQQHYFFRSEGLRVALGSLLGQQRRQQTQQRLVAALTGQPGLALYYAERAGLNAARPELLQAYRSSLPADSPLLGPARSSRSPLNGADRPVRRAAKVLPSWPGQTAAYQVWQGYLVSRSEHGWLNVSSQGRGGHPRTLVLQDRFTPQKSAECGGYQVRLIWRLDVYQAGQHFNPEQVPFALRLSCAAAPRRAFVCAPGLESPYREGGAEHVPFADAVLGEWMEHRLSWPAGTAPNLEVAFELSVRALDVSLTIASFEVSGQERLSGQT